MKLNDMIIKTIKDGKERNVNRRMDLGFEATGKLMGKLQSCWHVSYNNNIFTLTHWGTDILTYDYKNDSLVSALITSKSDRDSIQLALNYISDGLDVHYYPSKEFGTIVNSHDDTVVYQG